VSVIVYEHWSSEDDEGPFYVGKTKWPLRRFTDHMQFVKEHVLWIFHLSEHTCSNPHYCNKVAKQWRSGYRVWPIVKEVCDSDEVAQERERYWIAFWRSTCPGKLTNIRDGGGPTPEDMLRLSTDPEWLRKVREGVRAKCRTPEWLENNKQRCNSPENIARLRIQGARGAKSMQDPKTKAKWEAAMASTECKEKWAASQSSPEYKEKWAAGMERYRRSKQAQDS